MINACLYFAALIVEGGAGLKTPREMRLAAEELGDRLHIMMKWQREFREENGISMIEGLLGADLPPQLKN